MCRDYFKKAISYCFHVGVEMIIPGKGKVVVRMYLAAVNADKPALFLLQGLKEGQCSSGCNVCCYQTKRLGVTYDEEIHKDRDYNLQYRIQKFLKTKREQQKLNSAAVKEATKFIQKWGLLIDPPTLYGIPTAYVSPDMFYHICNSDLFHDLDSGVIPAINGDVVSFIQGIEKYVDGYQCVLANLDLNTSKKRVSRQVPVIKNLNYYLLDNGVPEIVLGKDFIKRIKGSTAGTGGLRSSWSINMSDKLLTAIGDDGKIAPDSSDYIEIVKKHKGVFKKNIKGKKKKQKSKKGEYEIEPWEEIISVRNPAFIICGALYAVMDVYYFIKRQFWNPSLVAVLELKLRRLQSFHVVLHHNVVALNQNAKSDLDYQVNNDCHMSLISLYY